MLDCYQDDCGFNFGPRYFPVTPEEYRKLTSNGTDVDLSGYYTSGQTDELLALKENLISDLDVIRSGASLGATALQSVPSEYVTDTELSTALSSKQDVLTAGANIEIDSGGTISAKGYEFNGETDGGFAEKYKQDSADGGQILNNTATGLGSHAEGYFTLASGDYGSHAEGCHTIASYECAHAEGYNTLSSGDSSHAEGQDTKATSNYAHAEGKKTNSTGYGSHAEGFETTAQNSYEHAEGTSNYSHTVSDSYGNAGNTQHSVGIGGGFYTEEDTRKNAFEIMQNGDTYLFGIGGYQGRDTKVQDASIKTLQEYIASLEARIAALENPNA